MAEISLEALANTITVLTEKEMKKLKIARIGGYVTGAEGGRRDYRDRNYLRIYLNHETQREHINVLNFHGTSPVRAGDKIRAGLILNGKMINEAFYIEIIDEKENCLRRDFMDDCGGGWFNSELGLRD